MVFTSIVFLFAFLPIILILYYILPGRMKNLVLLVGSLVFYTWGEPVYLILMVFSVLFNYILGLNIARNRRDVARAGKRLIIGIVVNVLALVFFGYIGVRVGFMPSVPIGIGIYTLKILSYLIEVYRGNVKGQKNVLDFSVYVTMFPQMIAGPVVKYGDIYKEIGSVRRLSWNRLGEGALLFICGLLKKVLLADNMAAVFGEIISLKSSELSVLTAWLGCAAYMFQIYFAFSGYADMAVGLGKMLGFEFGRNFRYPYTARSITDFWRKWNISLTSWFRSYVYEPLGGNKAGTGRTACNILIVWVCIGLWHAISWAGASWSGAILNCAAWGIYSALLLILEKCVLSRILKKLPAFIGHLYSLFLIVAGWVILFTPDLGQTLGYWKVMFGGGSRGLVDDQGIYLLVTNGAMWVILILGSTSLVHRICTLYRSAHLKRAAFVFSAALIVLSLLRVFNDGVADEEFFRSANTNIMYLLGRRDSGGVFKGKDNYLLAEIRQADMEQVTENLAAVDDLKMQYPEIPFYMMIVPDAANVLADKLPEFAVTEDQSAQLVQMKELIGNRIAWIDTEKVLKEHADKAVYYHTDPHWTTLGAWYAYQELASQMGLDTAKAPELASYAVTGDFNGALTAVSRYEKGYREPIYIYAAKESGSDIEVVVDYGEEKERTATLYDTSKLDEKDKYGVFLGGDYGMVDIRTTADSTDRLLIVKDSYANCFIPFLTPYYREIIVVDPSKYNGNIQNIIKENNITSVLFLYGCNTFVTDDKINGVLTDGKTE